MISECKRVQICIYCGYIAQGNLRWMELNRPGMTLLGRMAPNVHGHIACTIIQYHRTAKISAQRNQVVGTQ